MPVSLKIWSTSPSGSLSPVMVTRTRTRLNIDGLTMPQNSVQAGTLSASTAKLGPVLFIKAVGRRSKALLFCCCPFSLTPIL